MAVDFHPLLVHFPIALLTVYAILECLRFRSLRTQPWLVPTKAVLLIVGVFGAFFALATGDSAKRAYTDQATRHLISVHSTYAAATTWVFGILAALYIIRLLSTHVTSLKKNEILTPLARLASFVLDTGFIIVPLALIGLALVMITGALGGAIVYGPTADPIVQYITTLLGVAKTAIAF